MGSEWSGIGADGWMCVWQWVGAEVGAFVLNFNGRVTMASVKNFQLVNTEDSMSAPSLYRHASAHICALLR
jgi:hypothetical protein